MSGIHKGIDVSKWQGTIDWERVKAAGIEFAMLRAGFGRGNVDECFERNAQECTRLGIPFGVYWFSYAYTEEMARNEARYCLDAIAPYELGYPVAWDFEYDSVDFALERGVAVTKELASAMARAFLDEIRAAGYCASLYANPAYLTAYFDADIPNEYDIWLAKWPYTIPDPEPKPSQAGGMWQYTSSGSVDGIYGRVDMNYAYYEYPSIGGGEGDAKPVTWEQEKKNSRKWVMERGISDGERGGDNVTRDELWAMLRRYDSYKEGNV